MRQTLGLGLAICVLAAALAACAGPTGTATPATTPAATATPDAPQCIPVAAVVLRTSAHVPSLTAIKSYEGHAAEQLLALFNSIPPRSDLAADTILMMSGAGAPAVMIGSDRGCARWQVIIPSEIYDALTRALAGPEI